MKKVYAGFGSALFLVIAPGSIAGLFPYWISRWELRPAFLGVPALRGVGLLMIAFAVPALVESFVRFVVDGCGTPAPVAPPSHLVVKCLYRYVRNPMYVAVCSIVLGEALLLGDLHLLEYAAGVWAMFHFWVMVYEEPMLKRTFGSEYDLFRAHVPRWIPRFRPWGPDAARE
ncbi:MAG: isoprenylcysteine carboxyl methyltransferase [Acidobacteriales bacterium]|nr:isoprenylcysteine carboxyl methyltransferase [Terriglobales bacterium]